MRKLLNTLYITTPESYLSKDGENVLVRVGGEEKFRIPIHNIEGIVCFGQISMSPSLMGLCTDHNVGISFLSDYGRFLGRVSGKIRGNVILRREQYRLADSERSLEPARLFISGKIANCRAVINRTLRDHATETNTGPLTEAADLLHIRQKQALKAPDKNVLRGYEGDSAMTYFSVFKYMIVSQIENFPFAGRNRRPPKDNVNALLSFIYTLLGHDIQSALETVGLDPYVGFLHTDRPGRISLALDLMEELRPYLADRLVLSLINRRQITAKGFLNRDDSGVIMDNDTRKEVLTAWQKRKMEEIRHPFLDETISIGLLPHVQSLLLARYLRGDLEAYPVFVLR